jgi:hypothetical protein
LNSVEGDVHCDKEQSTLDILDTGFCWLDLPEQKNSKTSSENCGQQFDVTCLWQAKQIHEITLRKESKLITEASFQLVSILVDTDV